MLLMLAIPGLSVIVHVKVEMSFVEGALFREMREGKEQQRIENGKNIAHEKMV